MTGHDGYIGAVMAPFIRAAGHEVVVLDNFLFRDCDFGKKPDEITSLNVSIRSVKPEDLRGFDSVSNLSSVSNDPLGDLNPGCTYEINHRGTVHLARMAKEAGVPRFIHSSSCSLYGVAGEGMLAESATFNPVTPYGESKALVERDVSPLADARFSPTYLRNGTAFGVSPRLRADLVVNNLVGYAFTTGEVLIKSDGTPWRPAVHVEDISLAFLQVLEAP